MPDQVYASGSTLSSPARERHNEERRYFRMCAMDDAHDDDMPFAAVLATITSPAHGSFEHPRGRWQSLVPLCQACCDRLQEGLPFGYFMVDEVLPKLCQECGLPAPCSTCDQEEIPSHQ